MRRPARLWVLCLLVGLPGACVRAAEAGGENVMVTVKQDGCGFIDAIDFQGRKVVKAGKGFIGSAVTLAPAGDGTIDSLFANEASTVLAGAISSVRPQRDAILVEGAYTDGKSTVPFTRRIRVDPDKLTVTVLEQADFSGLDARHVIAGHCLDLPLVMNDDPHLRMFAFGGQHRAELFRMDMNDVSRRGAQNISCSRGYWPYWDIGGLLQLPGSYQVWKANHADTMAYPVEEGNGAPGWADYSELEWGITAAVAQPAAKAPWAIRIDARKGVFSISPHPASQPPVAGKDYGRRTFAFTLTLHRTSWPATYPCQLDVEVYERLLNQLVKRWGYRFAGALGTRDVRSIVHLERVQPAVALRALYRGDAYRMASLMKSIGRRVPRNQPLAKWEKEAKIFLDHVRANGVPAIR